MARYNNEDIISLCDWILAFCIRLNKRLDAAHPWQQQERASFYQPDWYHPPPDLDPPYAEMESHLSVTDRRVDSLRPPDLPEPEPPNAHPDWQQPTSVHQPSPPITVLQPPLTSAATAACLLPQTYQKQPLQPPQTYPSYIGGPTTYSGYVDYKRRIPQPPDPAPPYGAPTYGLPRAQTQMQHPIQPVGQPPFTEQPTTGWCPLPGDHRTAAPLQTVLIQPYRDCPMEAVAVHDEAIVVEEVQVENCIEVMLVNHKSCDGDEMPMAVPSGVGKVEKMEKSSQNSARKEKQVQGREEIEYSLQLNASRIKILQAQIGLGISMKDNASLKLWNDSSHVRDVAKMNHRSTSLDADARLIPPRHDTPSTQLRVSPSWFDMPVVKARGRNFYVGEFMTRKEQLHAVRPIWENLQSFALATDAHKGTKDDLTPDMHDSNKNLDIEGNGSCDAKKLIQMKKDRSFELKNTKGNDDLLKENSVDDVEEILIVDHHAANVDMYAFKEVYEVSHGKVMIISCGLLESTSTVEHFLSTMGNELFTFESHDPSSETKMLIALLEGIHFVASLEAISLSTQAGRRGINGDT